MEALCCSSHPGSLFLRFFSPSDSRRPSLLSAGHLFLICCCHPRSGCLSYQPGRTRIHILQAFMMAAAHLCKPVCLASDRQGSPPEQQTETAPGLPDFQSSLSLSLSNFHSPFARNLYHFNVAFCVASSMFVSYHLVSYRSKILKVISL